MEQKQESLMHVVALSPEEQLTLVLLSKNYLKLMGKSYMHDLASGSATSGDADEKWRRWCRLSDVIEELTYQMPTAFNFDNARSRLLQYTSRGIKAIIKIANFYDPSNAAMESEAMQVVDANIDRLKAKLKESENFTFTRSEVEEAIRSHR